MTLAKFTHTSLCVCKLYCVNDLPECWDRVPCRALTRVFKIRRIDTVGVT